MTKQLLKLSSYSQQKALSCLFASMLLVAISTVALGQKTSVASGNFNDPNSWNPIGIPTNTDQIVIMPNHIITLDASSQAESITIQNNGGLIISSNNKLTVKSSVIINGTLEIDEGDLELQTPGSNFSMGPNSTLVWNPADNTVNGASLFLKGEENFHSTSTLIIEKWYNYSQTPLGSVVRGDFGNVTLSTVSNGLIFEWDQKNAFEQHRVLGTLTINQGWVVLDKSGSIKNTFIGAIELKNGNSYLDFHNGDHPNNFTVTTNKITNTGGTINGISNGNGTINLIVNNDLLNFGNFCLIYNGGITNKGNGNSYLKVSGKFQQTHGDFRGIFNISGTAAGVSELNLGSVDVTGGIFMGQYACHTGTGKSKITIHGDLNINFTNNTDKFRGNGLTSLSGNQNSAKLELIIEGDLKISGNNASEFISSASYGSEIVKVMGDVILNGSNVSFNQGFHDTELYFEKSLLVDGASAFMSKTDGTLTTSIIRNLEINSGQLNIKGSTGIANLTVHGEYIQNGGTFAFHNNEIVPTSNVIYTTIHGNYSMNGGNLIFDNNSSTFVSHQISLNGSVYSIDGNANIYSAGTLNNPVFGIIYFDHTGQVSYNNPGNSVTIRNTKQVVSSGCVLNIVTGNMLAASTNIQVKDLVKVAPEGTLNLGINHIISTKEGTYSCIKVDESGRIITESPNGLYDGTPLAAINAEGNMTYSLHPASSIEYTGTSDQTITGIGLGTAQDEEHKYGILEINKQNGKAILQSSEVTVRTSLYLNEGELDLNNFNLTVNSGKQYAISQTNGYIRSEPNKPDKGGKVIWKKVESGNHVIPFGVAPNKLIPFSFNPVSGTGRDFAVSTSASNSTNRPLPLGISNLNINGKDEGISKIIDRYYYIKATGIIAAVNFSYLPEENSTNELFKTGNFSCINWDNTDWNFIGGTGIGTSNQTGSVFVNNVNTWGYMALASKALPAPADVLTFNAELVSGNVNLNWKTKSGINADKYIIERSSDGLFYESVVEQAAINNLLSTEYTDKDYSPFSGKSFYRLKQVDIDQTLKFSDIIEINNTGYSISGVEILSVGPNPFKNNFTVTYNTVSEAIINVRLTALNGQVIFENSEQVNPGINKFNYNNDIKLAPGMYLIMVSDGKSASSSKIFCY